MKLTIAALLFAGFALAQTPANPYAAMYSGQIRMIESELVPLVEAMPADKMDFAPTQGEFKGVRTFGQQAKHVGAVVYLVAAAAKGEPTPAAAGQGEAGPADVKTREQIAKYLRDAFAYARAVAETMTRESAMAPVKNPFGPGEAPKSNVLSAAVWHSFDHYGQMVVYARMNGIVPPASRR